MDNTSDVIVFYHATFCNACMRFSDTWRELSEETAPIKNLVVAHMDGSQNEVEGLTFRKHGSFPCVRLYPAGDKTNVKEFEFDPNNDGNLLERTLEDVNQFLFEKSKIYQQALEDKLINPKQFRLIDGKVDHMSEDL